MRKNFIRPDEDKLRRVLEVADGAVEVILRLAWCVGLTPDELHALTWPAVDFAVGTVCLPDRTVPLDAETLACLSARHAAYRVHPDWPAAVLLTDRRHTHMTTVQMYRLVRTALDAGGLPSTQLTDLRDDYIIRLLETGGTAAAIRLGGVAVRTLYTSYAPWLPEKQPAVHRPPTVDAPALAALIAAEGPTPAGLTLLMVWRMGLTLPEITALTWQDTDLAAGRLLSPRPQPLPPPLAEWLCTLSAARSPNADPHILLTPRAGTPFDKHRLSVVTRTVLIRGGMEHLTLADLARHGLTGDDDSMLLDHAQRHGWIDRATAMSLLHLSPAAAYAALTRLTDTGVLIRIGTRCYPADAIVPPSRHEEIICAHLGRVGGAYRGELAQLLNIEVRSCGWILNRLLKEGKLVRKGHQYFLPNDLNALDKPAALANR